MVKIRAFPGLRPRPELAEMIASPPYDVLSSEEARRLAAANDKSFLHVNKPEIDLAATIDPYSTTVYEKGRDNLRRFIDEQWLVQDVTPSIYLYRLTWRGHQQTGFFCLSSVDDYDAGRIKKHELTRAKKEKDRSDLIDTMNAQVGPVFLLYKANERLNTLLKGHSTHPAPVDFTTTDGVQHELWVIDAEADITAIEQGFAELPATYVADGHHRSASASNVCRARRAANPSYTGEEPFNYFLSVIFPDDQLQILPYNRVIRDLNGLEPEEFLARVRTAFTLETFPGEVIVEQPHTFAMYLGGVWYRLLPLPDSWDAQDVLENLDVNILVSNLLEPVLGIGDPRTDPRIDFVGGIRGNQELEQLVDTGKFAVAFALYPTSVELLIGVADAGEIMPPKSTWFEPKLRSGMVCHLL
ncbi:MAG: DUF1015 domain-containing protein [Candidatus Delongbacteria bacterium]|nr:DUF1015 domain-containing protein [Candidatus Delongbacteria bacterium]